ncbi:hypothetical protein J2X65_003864 [Ancylobacter sp. 3268]|uniref:NepR family anti-sigma factor n=1 Tax=Ancylobacter sp. 3268 TaxID=2817752 RepID=UPI00286166B8|nr:hypothetical protein [Ancylobacter sp. 3268]
MTTEDENEGRGAVPDAVATTPQRMSATALDGDIQAKIGQHLRAMYDDVVRQGVPNRFLDLLSQLDQPSGAGKKPGGGAGS